MNNYVYVVWVSSYKCGELNDIYPIAFCYEKTSSNFVKMNSPLHSIQTTIEVNLTLLPKVPRKPSLFGKGMLNMKVVVKDMSNI